MKFSDLTLMRLRIRSRVAARPQSPPSSSDLEPLTKPLDACRRDPIFSGAQDANKTKVISQKLWKPLLSLLVPPARSVQGGRPRVDDFAALNGILFVLTTGIPWEDRQKNWALAAG